MGFDLPAAAMTVGVVATVAVVLGAVLTLMLRRRTSISRPRATWIGFTALSAMAVLVITMVPGGQRVPSACYLRVDGSILNWLTQSQPLANVLMLVPLGIALPLAARGTGWYRWSFLALFAFPVVIEAAQSRLPLGRACDLTDVVDNWWGVVIGIGLGWAGSAICAGRGAPCGTAKSLPTSTPG
ncbi:MAG: VanZ family protein [Acidimicrobiales bacterium]|nr:VanZ family protein [Acidimicrobiales bacterium]